MTPPLSLRLFGGATILLNGMAIEGLTSQKARALLFYVACHPHPVPRDVLATLLFGDSPTQQALSNLRTLLARLKPVATYLEVERQTIGINTTAPVEVDVMQFTTGMAETVRLAPRRTPLTPPASQILEQSVSLYRGEFLAGFFLNDAREWEEWATVMRERWHHQAVEGYERLVGYCVTNGEHRRGIQLARRLLELDPLREEAHRQMMTLLARDHQRVAALAQYEQCRRILAEELGVDPARETAELHERILTLELGDERDTPTVPLRPHNLNRALTPFVGRDGELTHIRRAIADPDCHLFTIVGPGGIGKSRLALQAAWAVANDPTSTFADGVFWVPLASVTQVEHVAIAIADALHLELQGKATPSTQVRTFLQNKSMLLLLDNLEHLNGIADEVLTLLQAAPQMKMITTSRERLNLQAEWLLALDGLPCPDETTPPDRLETFEACTLFLRHARRLSPAFSLDHEDKQALSRLCTLVDGMPLGLELAATFLQHLSLPELVTELERDLDVLTVNLRDVPERHRSLRAVYEQSWRRLSEAEQRFLAQLAIFRGGFTRVAAEQIAGATLSGLLALEQKSLLQRDRTGRYELHELLRQFTAEKLDDAGAALKGHHRHADYFTRLVHRLEPHLRGRDALTALETMRLEVDNVRAAWVTAIDYRDTEALHRAMEGLTRFYSIRGWYQEGATAMGTAADILAALPYSDNAITELRGELLARKAKCLEIIDYETAIATYELSLRLLREAGNRLSQAAPLTGLGYLAQMRGNYGEAQASLHESLKLSREAEDWYGEALTLNTLCQTLQRMGKLQEAREAGIAGLTLRRMHEDHLGIASSLTNLGLLDCQLGAYATARDEFTESLALYKRLNVKIGIANTLNGLCQSAFYQEDIEGAIAYAKESLNAYREIGDVWGEGLVLNNLGYLANEQGQYQEAIPYLAEAVTLFRKHRIHTGLSGAHRNLANAYRDLGQWSQAEQHYREALQVAQTGGGVSYLLQALVQYARLLALQGNERKALVLYAFAKNQSALNHSDRRRAEEWFEELAPTQPLETVAAAVAQADTLTVETVIDTVVA